jgi:choline kinase
VIDRAIVLAAGRGNRIARVGTTPKPLLSLSGEDDGPTFLDLHLVRLAAAGVREIVIVGNSRTAHTRLRAEAALPSTTKLAWVVNPTEDLSTSGSGHSLSFATDAALDGASRVLFMDADVVYDDRAFATLDAWPADRSASLVCPRLAADSEEVVVFADPRAPGVAVDHGKGLVGAGLLGDATPVGEATGLVLLAPSDHALARAAIAWCLGYSTAKLRTEHEDVTRLLMRRGRVDVAMLPADALFMEVDTPDDYARLVRDVWPRLRGAFAAPGQ